MPKNTKASSGDRKRSLAIEAACQETSIVVKKIKCSDAENIHIEQLCKHHNYDLGKLFEVVPSTTKDWNEERLPAGMEQLAEEDVWTRIQEGQKEEKQKAINDVIQNILNGGEKSTSPELGVSFDFVIPTLIQSENIVENQVEKASSSRRPVTVPPYSDGNRSAAPEALTALTRSKRTHTRVEYEVDEDGNNIAVTKVTKSKESKPGPGGNIGLALEWLNHTQDIGNGNKKTQRKSKYEIKISHKPLTSTTECLANADPPSNRPILSYNSYKRKASKAKAKTTTSGSSLIDWTEKVLTSLKEMRKKQNAPVDSQGCEKAAAVKPHERPENMDRQTIVALRNSGKMEIVVERTSTDDNDLPDTETDTASEASWTETAWTPSNTPVAYKKIKSAVTTPATTPAQLKVMVLKSPSDSTKGINNANKDANSGMQKTFELFSPRSSVLNGPAIKLEYSGMQMHDDINNNKKKSDLQSQIEEISDVSSLKYFGFKILEISMEKLEMEKKEALAKINELQVRLDDVEEEKKTQKEDYEGQISVLNKEKDAILNELFKTQDDYEDQILVIKKEKEVIEEDFSKTKEHYEEQISVVKNEKKAVEQELLKSKASYENEKVKVAGIQHALQNTINNYFTKDL